MKTFGLLVALVVGGSADDLMTLRLGPIRVRAPAAWHRSMEQGSHKFLAPSGEAYFLIDVGQVQAKEGLEAAVCRDKIVQGLGGKGWENLSIDSEPAAWKKDLDPTQDNKGAVESYSFVGCNGKTTWSLLFHYDAKKKDRFGPLAKKIAETVEYTGPKVTKDGGS